MDFTRPTPGHPGGQQRGGLRRDPSGGLLALRASDGKLLWAAPQPFRTGPVVAGGSVYVSNGSMVYAYTA